MTKKQSKKFATIDSYLFEKYFQKFVVAVENKSGISFKSFSGNRYTEESEGYKDDIYETGREILSFEKWTKDEIGSMKIAEKFIQSLYVKNNNLVHYQQKIHAENILKNSQYVKIAEEALFNFYRDLNPDSESLENFVQIFGSKYDLIAYIYFLKDKSRYMPISTTNLDTGFQKLGIKHFKTTGKCTWDNYKRYNAILSEVKILLTERGVYDVTLLNAHSFVWMLVKDVNILKTATDDDIKLYYGLKEREKNAVVKSRIGQGLYRENMLRFWNGQCAVTGIDNETLLTASHLKPFKDSSPKEAYDYYNGLLLNPLYDKLIDAGLITFEPKSGRIIISPKLSKRDRKILNIDNSILVKGLEDGHRPYLLYHQKEVFKK